MMELLRPYIEERLKVANLWRKNAELKHGLVPPSQDGLTRLRDGTHTQNGQQLHSQATIPESSQQPAGGEARAVAAVVPAASREASSDGTQGGKDPDDGTRRWITPGKAAGLIAAGLAAVGGGSAIGTYLGQRPVADETTIVREGEMHGNVFDYLMERGEHLPPGGLNGETE